MMVDETNKPSAIRLRDHGAPQVSMLRVELRLTAELIEFILLSMRHVWNSKCKR